MQFTVGTGSSMNRLAGSLLLIVLLAGCGSPNSRQLRDGFVLLRVYGDNHSIVRPSGSELVAPSVRIIVDSDSLIVGIRYASEPPLPSSYDEVDQPYGYFIYAKFRDELRCGLEQEDVEVFMTSPDW